MTGGPWRPRAHEAPHGERKPKTPLHPPLAFALFGSLLSALFILAFVAPNPAAAQEPAPDPSPPANIGIEISHVTSFVPADGLFMLEVKVTPANLGRSGDDYELAVTVFEPLESEEAVDWVLTRPLGRLESVRLQDLPPDPEGRSRLAIPITANTQFDDRSRIQLPEAGVYPVSVELRSPTGLWASARTNLIRLSGDTQGEASPPIAIVLAVSPAEGLTTEAAAGLLERHRNLPLTVLLQEGVETQLAAEPDLLRRFVDALGDRPAISPLGLRLDASALVEVEEVQLYHDERLAAQARLETHGLQVPPNVVLADSPLTRAGALALLDADIDLVLNRTTVSADTGRLRTSAGVLDVLGFDQAITGILADDDAGPVLANRILATLVLRGEAGGSPVVFGGPVTSARTPTDTYDPFFTALSQPGAPRPVYLTELLTASNAVPLQAWERPIQDLRPISTMLTETLRGIETYEQFYREGGRAPAVFRRQVAASLTIDRNPTSRRQALELVRSEVSEQLSVVALPHGQPLTIAAQSATIPLIVESWAEGPRSVLLRFRGEKVIVSQDEQLVVIEPGISSIDLAVQTRSLGVSNLDVSIWTPGGEQRLASSRFEVRSTAVPGLSLVISITAVVLLVVWWVLDSRRKARSHRARVRRRHPTAIRADETSVDAAGELLVVER